MRVNVDSKALSDPRFARLGARLKMNRAEALGRCVPVWMQAYENRNATIKAIDADALAEVAGFAKALVEVDLAQSRGKSIRLRGVDERIYFLLVQDAKREKANAARMAPLRDVPRGKRSDDARTNAAVSPGTLPGRGPYSPDLDQPPAHDPAPDHDHEQAAAAELAKQAGQTSSVQHPTNDGWKPSSGGDAEAEANRRVAAGAITEDDVRACWKMLEDDGIRDDPPARQEARALGAIRIQKRRSRRVRKANAKIDLTAPKRDYTEPP